MEDEIKREMLLEKKRLSMANARNTRKSKKEIRQTYEEQIKSLIDGRENAIKEELDRYKQTEYEADRLKLENIASVINKDAEDYFNRIIDEKERTIQLLRDMLIRPNAEVNKHSTDNKYNIESPEDYAMKMQLLKYKEEMRNRALDKIAKETFS